MYQIPDKNTIKLEIIPYIQITKRGFRTNYDSYHCVIKLSGKPEPGFSA